MKKCDMYINDFKTRLGLSDNFTFGLELEFDFVNDMKEMRDFIKNAPLFLYWVWKYEITVPNGGEINSPILVDSVLAWKDLDKILDYCKKNSEISENCGGHIHIGAQIFEGNTTAFLNFLLLFSVYEDIIMTHCYNEFSMPRQYLLGIDLLHFKLQNAYDTFISKKNPTFSQILYEFNKTSSRNEVLYFKHATDFNNFKPNNTIEFRFPNSSFETSMWQNNVYLFYKLIEYSKRKDFNTDLLLENRHYIIPFDEKAYELADLLFNNEQDKEIFLNQVFKEDYKKEKDKVRSR